MCWINTIHFNFISVRKNAEIFYSKGNRIVFMGRKRNSMLARNYMRIVYLSEQRVTRAAGFECTWFLCLVLSRLDDRSYLLYVLLLSTGRNKLTDARKKTTRNTRLLLQKYVIPYIYVNKTFNTWIASLIVRW